MVVDKIIASEDNTYYHIEDTDDWYVEGLVVNGQCGISEATTSIGPVKIELKGIEKIRVGKYRSFFITKDHELYANGHNDYGELGIGDLKKACVTKVSIDNVSEVYLMNYRTFIQTTDDRFFVCGMYNEDFSQKYKYPHEIDIEEAASQYRLTFPVRLSDGSWKIYNAPESLPENIIDVVSAYGRFYYLTSNGQVYANGHGYSSLFGIHVEKEPKLELHQVRELPIQNVKSIKAGRYHTLFLTEDDKLHAIGNSFYGQLGMEFEVACNSDLSKVVAENVIYIEAGPSNTYYALKNGDIMKCGVEITGGLSNLWPKKHREFTFSTKVSNLKLPPKKKVDYTYQDILHRIIITYEVQDYDKLIMSSYINTPSINKLTKIEEDIMFHFTTANMDKLYKDLEVVSDIRIEELKQYIRLHTNFYDIPKMKTKTLIKLTNGSLIEVEGSKTKEECINIVKNYVYTKYNTVYDTTAYYNESTFNNLVDGNPLWKPKASQVFSLSELNKTTYNTY